MTATELSELREKSRRFASSSIVADALGRLVEQILLEVHETQIAPRDKRIAYLEDLYKELRRLANAEATAQVKLINAREDLRK